jgi:orotate phosphoribosyltransferase
VLTCRRLPDSKTGVEHRECLHRFSLLKASTETDKNGFFQFGGGFLYDYSFKINHFLNFTGKEFFKKWFFHENGVVFYGKGGMAMKQELIELLCKKSFKYSEEPVFKLVSGKMSRFYVNCKPTAMDPRGMYLIGHLVFDAIRGLGVDGVGGLTFGADPVAMATAFVSGLQNEPVSAFSIRKDQKDHGIVKWIEGDLSPGQRVVVIDDVATTGGSTLKAVERARSEGLIVVKVVVLVDRQEGGMENIRGQVPDVSAIITRDELIGAWKKLKRESNFPQ